MTGRVSPVVSLWMVSGGFLPGEVVIIGSRYNRNRGRRSGGAEPPKFSWIGDLQIVMDTLVRNIHSSVGWYNFVNYQEMRNIIA